MKKGVTTLELLGEYVGNIYEHELVFPFYNPAQAADLVGRVVTYSPGLGTLT
ncbi:hypothetical protein [Brevibacterium aurantiacum]|uniref:hypothetical protein n=1 Tax=Brevibacterium aurantiacum TaxID=273384 RepID=UPI0013FE312E|nr:hypothetical protein [Brevibacterium aurantiacum]